MSISTAKRALGVALTTLAFFGATSLARADINDYEFQLIQKEIKKGDAILSVRLVHKPDGKVVPDAVIFATRLDMAPDSMADDHFAEEIRAGVVETESVSSESEVETVGVVRGVAGSAP